MDESLSSRRGKVGGHGGPQLDCDANLLDCDANLLDCDANLLDCDAELFDSFHVVGFAIG